MHLDTTNNEVLQHHQFYADLLNKIRLAYECSEIKSRNLYYSLSATPIYQRTVLITGFNWGAGKDQKYDSQVEMPVKSFKLEDTGSFKRIHAYLDKYLPDVDQDKNVQSNFCFFRSKTESEISQADLELCKPIFNALLDYIQPKAILSFSARLRDYLREKVRNLTSHTSTGKRSVSTFKGVYHSGSIEAPIYFLPHPNSRIRTQAREECWKFCFENESLKLIEA